MGRFVDVVWYDLNGGILRVADSWEYDVCPLLDLGHLPFFTGIRL